jgi:hypothetical protein
MHLCPLAGAARSRQLSQIYCFLKGLYADQYLNVQLTDVSVILKARMLYDVYSSGTIDEVEFSVLRLKTGLYEPMGSTSSGLCLPASLSASRNFDSVLSLRIFLSPGGSKTLPTLISMGSERWLDSILESCISGIGLLYVEMESFLPIQKCSNDEQRYKAMCPATAMGGRFLFYVARACVRCSLVVIRCRVAGYDSCRGSRALTGLSTVQAYSCKGDM